MESIIEERDVATLLEAHAAGDRQALRDLIPLLYDDLRRIAHRHLSREPDGHTLNTTAVVHEAYLRLADETRATWPSRAHFLGFASKVMRHVLIDYGRRRSRQKRGGGMDRVPLHEGVVAVRDASSELLALDEALTALSDRHERMGRVVECRLFGGMQATDVAEALDVSVSTVERDWRAAKAYLYRALVEDAAADPL